MSLADVLLKRWGVRSQAAQKTVSVGVAAVQIVPNNPQRLALTIINLSTNSVYIALDNSVAATKGMVLQPTGGSATFSLDEDFQMVGWEIWGIATGAASAVYVIEVTEY
jgi:hypothetical protein